MAVSSVAQPAPSPARTGNAPAGTFAAIAALGAVFAGFDAHGRNPDWVTSALAAGLTFCSALVTMYVLHFVFRVTLALLKLAIPVAAVLLVGCSQQWPWAESAVQWLAAVGHRGLVAAEQAWVTLRAE